MCAGLLATACGEYGGGSTPVAGSLREYLRTTPEACGLDDASGVDPAALERARTVDDQVARIALLVERVRGLRGARAIRRAVVSPATLERTYRRELSRGYSRKDAALERRALVLLGAIPPKFPLRDEVVGALSEDLAGFYDPERHRILVAREGEGRLDDFELEIVAHELVHALVDRKFELEEGRPGDNWGDSGLAGSALEEGDATAVEFRFIGLLEGRQALRDLIYATAAAEVFVVPDLPHYLAAAVVFPYREGLGFVCGLYARGGWKAVDAAHKRPPATTAEILFPERYLRRVKAEQPPPAGRLGAGWKLQKDIAGRFGAADLLWLFEAPGARRSRALAEPRRRAAAWAGGRLELLTRGPHNALSLALVDRGSSRALCESIVAWYGAAYPRASESGSVGDTRFWAPGQAAVVSCSGRDVLVAIAPDLDTARRLATPG